MNTILLLEDDRNLNRGITLKLRKEGYHVLSAFGATEAKKLFQEHSVDLIISDITLQDGNGLDFCASIRKSSNVYIIFLTALDTEIDMVTAYDTGADDYITKPFSLMVLVSKVHAFMRRLEGKQKNRIVSGPIEVTLSDMKAYKKDAAACSSRQLFLSRKEWQLLVYLMENAGQIISKEQILSHVWDVDGNYVDENTVPVNISRLKGKIGSGYIQNVRGMGYIWVKECIRE